jgi:hypothetical protein
MGRVYRNRPAHCPGRGEKKPGNFPGQFADTPGHFARLVWHSNGAMNTSLLSGFSRPSAAGHQKRTRIKQRIRRWVYLALAVPLLATSAAHAQAGGISGGGSAPAPKPVELIASPPLGTEHPFIGWMIVLMPAMSFAALVVYLSKSSGMAAFKLSDALSDEKAVTVPPPTPPAPVPPSPSLIVTTSSIYPLSPPPLLVPNPPVVSPPPVVAEPVSSSSRLIAFFGLVLTGTFFFAFGTYTLWTAVFLNAIPQLEGPRQLLIAAAALFLPYVSNQFRNALEGKFGAK